MLSYLQADGELAEGLLDGLEGGKAPGPVSDKAEVLKQSLVDEFRSVIDEPLILALVFERDIVADYDATRQILLSLAAGAEEEATMGFDPSGLGSQGYSQGLRLDEHVSTTSWGNAAAVSAPESWATTEGSTTFSSEPSDAALLDMEPDSIRFTEQTNLTDQEKVENLMVIFPNLGAHIIRLVLNQDDGDLEKAFDTLLATHFLKDSGVPAKDIDSLFREDDEYNEGEWHLVHRGKAKAPHHATQARRQRQRIPLLVNYSISPPASDRSGSGSGASDGMINPKQPGKTRGIGAISSPSSTGSAVSTAQRSRPPLGHHLKTFSDPTSSTGGSSPWQTVEKKKNKRKKAATGSASAPPLSSPTTPPTINDLSASDHLRRAASELRRKGPLGRQAAAVYTERARANAPAQSLEDARRLVDAQSSPGMLDLHGVTVMDGVRIAKERVRVWWDALPEEAREGKGGGRSRVARLDGLSIVTGVGNHSAVHGVSRLRQAVGAALHNNGWLVETLTGKFYVYGRR